MKEEVLYDAVGKWFVDEKGCQQDEYSQGYLKNIQIGDVRPDILAIRYEILTDRTYPVIHFHGYVVEIKGDEKGLNELIGKIIRIKRQAKTSEEWMCGLHTVRFYIAYPTEQVSSDIFEICENDGIGILRLQVINENIVNIYEVLEAKEITLNGMSHNSQRSPGVFEDSINSINYLKQMFQRPAKLYEDFIRPKIDEYKDHIKLNTWLNTLTNRYAKEALDFLIEQILSEYPQLELKHHDGFVCNGRVILKINIGTSNFNIELADLKYRIHAIDYIIEFKDKEGNKYDGDLKKLIKDIVIPYIRKRLEG